MHDMVKEFWFLEYYLVHKLGYVYYFLFFIKEPMPIRVVNYNS